MRWLIETRMPGGWHPKAIIEGEYRLVLDHVMGQVPNRDDWRLRRTGDRLECLPIGRLNEAGLVDVTFRRLHLYSMGRQVEQGLIRAGHYGICQGDNILDLGCATTVMPLAYRPLALDMGDNDNLIQVYDEDSPAFQHIKQQADASAMSRCMWGKQFLLFVLPRSMFVTFYFATKSNRPVGDLLTDYLSEERSVRLRAKPESFGDKTWYLPTIESCRTRPKNLPSIDVIDKTRRHFATMPSDFWRMA